jgi:pentatricopeptide repeat protein
LFSKYVNKGQQPTDFMCNFVVEAAVKAGRIERAMAMFDEMTDNGIRHTATTYQHLAAYYATHGPDVEKLMKLWELASKDEVNARMFERDATFVSYTLMAIAHNRDYADAIEFYESKKDIVTSPWLHEALSALALSYYQTGKIAEAVALCEKLHVNKEARPVAYLTMLNHAVNTNDLPKFREYAEALAAWAAQPLDPRDEIIFVPWRLVTELVELMQKKRFVSSISPASSMLPQWVRHSVLNLTLGELRSFCAVIKQV